MSLRRFHAVVLAAGLGSRFQGRAHKALVPVKGNAGTLSLLLDQLNADASCDGITVVTGGQAAAIAEFVERRHVDVRVVHNENFATGGPLHSLRAGLAGLPDQDVWVFNADTVYDPAFMAAIAVTPITDDTWAAVSAAPLPIPGQAPDSYVAVPVCVDKGRVIAFGAHCRGAMDMAPAVWWSRRSWSALLHDESVDDHYQRDVLARLIVARPGCVVAQEVPPGSFFDVDTHADWVRARGLLDQ